LTPIQYNKQRPPEFGSGVDGEDAGEFEQTLLDPAAAVFKAVAAVTVLTAKEGATYAARYAVVVRGGVEG